jgi:hypothetical protein
MFCYCGVKQVPILELSDTDCSLLHWLHILVFFGILLSSAADPDHFDTGPDPTFHFDTAPDPDPIVWSPRLSYVLPVVLVAALYISTV